MVKDDSRTGSRFYGKLDGDVLSDWSNYLKSKDLEFLQELINDNSSILGAYADEVRDEIKRRKENE